MDFKDPNGLSRLVQSLTVSVDDAERFHPPEAALQTKQYLGTIRGHLRHTLRWHSASPAVAPSPKSSVSYPNISRAQMTACRSMRPPVGMHRDRSVMSAACGLHAGAPNGVVGRRDACRYQTGCALAQGG